MELTGTVKFKSDIQQKSDKFKMIDVVITDTSNTQYPQYISFQVVNDRCGLVDDVAVGDVVNVWFNIRGRQWVSPSGEVKYFNTLEIWKINKESVEKKDVIINEYADSAPTSIIDTGTNIVTNTISDDLPF